jgi:hypothetical protein
VLEIALWVLFAWLHEIATHSPLLALTSAEADSGKTTLCGVLKNLAPRAYTGAELTGPGVYRICDRLHPTLVVDDADQLFEPGRMPVSWARLLQEKAPRGRRAHC